MRQFIPLVSVCLLTCVVSAQPLTGKAERHSRKTRPAPVTAAQYVNLDLAQAGSCAVDEQHRPVAVTARILAYHARLHSIELFDESTRRVITVSLGRLPLKTRQALLAEKGERVRIFGRLINWQGKCSMIADGYESAYAEMTLKR